MAKKNIKDLQLNGKKVLMRVDFNVPMKGGVITDDNRIVQALPTIRYALEQGGKVIFFSHLGRIKTEEDLAKNSLALVAKRLEELLGQPVKFVPVTSGKVLEDAIANMKNGEVIMFENTRYEDLNGKKESKNDPELGAYWASLGDVFVNDAFGTAHRAHASNQGIASHFPNDSAAGFLLEKEIKFIGGAVDNPVRPFVAILGGAKVSDKISVIENLLNKADKVMICGAMAYTFFKAQGLEVGKSKCEPDFVEYAKGLLEKANGKIILPVDVVTVTVSDEDVAADFFGAIAKADTELLDVNDMINLMHKDLDCGPKTIALFTKELEGAKTVVWNGPAGVFEVEKFAKGTKAICEALANLDGATTIIGGGDSAAAAISMGYETKFTHISTGGGASLEYLEGKALPGVTCLSDVK
ncbi:MAG: phosphoglycerate kinase [Bacilli bacterium]